MRTLAETMPNELVFILDREKAILAATMIEKGHLQQVGNKP
jgi:hypothetical protein